MDYDFLIAERMNMNQINQKYKDWRHFELVAHAITPSGDYVLLKGVKHELKPSLYTLYAVNHARREGVLFFDVGRSYQETWLYALDESVKFANKHNKILIPQFTV